MTCSSFVHLFDAKRFLNAFLSISASYDRKNLNIQVYERGADPEELSVSWSSFCPRFSGVIDILCPRHLINFDGFRRLRPMSWASSHQKRLIPTVTITLKRMLNGSVLSGSAIGLNNVISLMNQHAMSLSCGTMKGPPKLSLSMYKRAVWWKII